MLDLVSVSLQHILTIKLADGFETSLRLKYIPVDAVVNTKIVCHADDPNISLAEIIWCIDHKQYEGWWY